MYENRMRRFKIVSKDAPTQFKVCLFNVQNLIAENFVSAGDEN